MDIKELKTTIIKNQHNKKIQNCIGSVGKTVEELFDGIDESFPVELPVLKKIADLTKEANAPLLDVVNKAKTEMFDIELAMDAFVTINKKLKEILDLTKQ